MTEAPSGARQMAIRKNVGVLISGRGSNMDALIAAARKADFPARIAVAISNRPGAPGLAKAERAGIPAELVDHRDFATRHDFEQALTARLERYDVEMVCNAGFMRLLTATFVNRWYDRHLNIHPSLLPAFRGLETHARVLHAGVRMTGCTVHIVREAMDEGPIVAQAAVPVGDGDTPEALAARVLEAEHRLYPWALAMMAGGEYAVCDERVCLTAMGKSRQAESGHTGEPSGPLIAPAPPGGKGR